MKQKYLKSLFLFLFFSLFMVSCSLREDKKIIDCVESTLKAAKDGNFEDFCKNAPFLNEYEEEQKEAIIHAFAQFYDKKDQILVLSKKSDDDIRVKLSFTSDFIPIVFVCYKKDNQYFLTDMIINVEEIDYVEAEK